MALARFRQDKLLIDTATELMNKIHSYKYDMGHIKDVENFACQLLEELDIDDRIVKIAVYWHDVGRLYKQQGHEEESAKMLITEMKKRKYKKEFITDCADAIRYHNSGARPKTMEGLLVRDAEKLACIGRNRWLHCLRHDIKLSKEINRLDTLKEQLYFAESKTIFDWEIVSFSKLLFNEMWE